MPCNCSRCQAQRNFCQCAPVRTEDVTALFLSGDLPIQPSGIRALPTAKLQLPGYPNKNLTAEITALVDGLFAPVETSQSTTTDSEGYFELEMPEGTRYIHFRLLFNSAGVRMEAHCFEPQGTLGIWDDSGDLRLRAALLRADRFSVDTSAADHVGAKQQSGPCRTSRAQGIVRAAIYEAINSISPHSVSKFNVAPAPASASLEAAIAQAMHDSLLWLYSAQSASLADELAADLATVQTGFRKTQGIAAGAAAAATVIAARAGDGGNSYVEQTWVDFYTTEYGGNSNPSPPLWKQDPVSLSPIAMGSKWADTVAPFVLSSATQFSVDPPPDYLGPEFAQQMMEVAVLGGDVTHTPTVRSEDSTEAGIFWGYDGSAVCAPSRMYSQVATQIATCNAMPTWEFARMLALLHIGMADVGIACWYYKYHYKLARPVTMIRDIGTDNPGFVGNPNFYPLGAPATGTGGNPFTPPFPALPSGHASFGGFVFQLLRNLLGNDAIPFTFVSDEYNGIYRPWLPRSFCRLSQAEEENGQSRIYLGVHYNADKTTGITLGTEISDYISSELYQPI